MSDWKQIKAEYIAGGTSYRKLAKNHGVKFSALRSIAERENWVALKAQTQHKTDTKLTETVSDNAVKKAVSITDVADKLLTKISEFMDAVPLDTQAMKHLTSALKDIKDIKGFKTDADMREQEARIRNLEKMAAADEKIDTTVTVKFEEDITKWSK